MHGPVEVQTTMPQHWDRFVEEHPRGTIYHSSRWLRLICETYGYRLLFILRQQGTEIQAGMPVGLVDSWLTGRRMIAFPFSDSCEPLTPAGENGEIFLAVADQERHRLGYSCLEVRGFEGKSPRGDKPIYLNHRLALDKSTQQLWQGLHVDCIRRRIEKARRLGVFCEIADVSKSENSHRDFYRLHSLTRRRQGVPIQPYRFFQSLFSSMTDSPVIHLSFANYRGKRVAAVLVLNFGDVAYFKFGASDDRFNSTGANQLLMWQAIRSAQLSGARVFDFGRTSTANRGLREYKRRWGTTEGPFYYLVLPVGGRPQSLVETSRRHDLMKRALRHMPMWANRLAGECLYRHLA